MQCLQCGKELHGYQISHMLCTECERLEEEREWRSRQEEHDREQREREREREREQRERDREREREQRERDRERREQWEREQERTQREFELRERELEEQRLQREWAEEQQANQDEVRQEEIAYNNALPKCKWCGKQYSFSPDANSYYEYCSKKCASDDLGKDRVVAYSQNVYPWIQEQINKAFLENIHKAIVLSEGFSQLFTPQQHLTIALALSQHRSYFIQKTKLIELQQWHYAQAFAKSGLEQKMGMACSPWTNQMHLERISLNDCFIPYDTALDFIMRIFEENETLPLEFLEIFGKVFKYLSDDGLIILQKGAKKPMLCSMIFMEQRDREDAKECKRQEEERKRLEEERKRQEEERKRQEEERKRQEEKRKRQEEEKRKNYLIITFLSNEWAYSYQIYDDNNGAMLGEVRNGETWSKIVDLPLKLRFQYCTGSVFGDLFMRVVASIFRLRRTLYLQYRPQGRVHYLIETKWGLFGGYFSLRKTEI